MSLVVPLFQMQILITGTTTADWVLQKVNDIHYYVGLSCEGFEEN
jgi:hypothetical protein